ncbi:MAG: helix-turn-helix domain-containing protein [Hyphomicrobiales bacterium]|nr:helix-turn-helix domain-containing protein [Hyphomicrobiales bacterium]
MPEFRTSAPLLTRRPPAKPTEARATPKPRADLVDVFARLLPGVVVTPATFRSETALAGQLRVDARRIRELRAAGLATPKRLGRGWVYGPSDIRTLSVMLALSRLGATTRELERFFDENGREESVSAAAACRAFCENLAERMEEEIARLRALDALVADAALENDLQR